jgi:hypothetical protein
MAQQPFSFSNIFGNANAMPMPMQAQRNLPQEEPEVEINAYDYFKSHVADLANVKPATVKTRDLEGKRQRGITMPNAIYTTKAGKDITTVIVSKAVEDVLIPTDPQSIIKAVAKNNDVIIRVYPSDEVAYFTYPDVANGDAVDCSKLATLFK